MPWALPAQRTFANTRRAFVQAAGEQYGQNSTVQNAARAAFTDVGKEDKTPTPGNQSGAICHDE